MTRGFRAVLVAAAAVATLAFANGAFAANTGSLTVYHSPMTLASTGSTTIQVSVPQSTDPTAAVNIYSGTGYTAKLDQAAGTKIGTVDATALSRDNNLTLPLTGDVTVDNAASAANRVGSAQCTGLLQSAAVWVMNLSVAGNTLPIPIYVNPTDGAPDQALGGYRQSICLPPPDVPIGTPGRSANGAQVLDAKFTVNGIFSTPSTAGILRWESLFTPYNPGKGTVNLAGTFETRSLVALPVALSLTATHKGTAYTVRGKASEGGIPAPGTPVLILRGTLPSKLVKVAAARTSPVGTFSSSGKVRPKKTTYFKATAAVKERDFTAQGCTNPLPATVAPAGCVSATLPPWTATSPVVKVKS